MTLSLSQHAERLYSLLPIIYRMRDYAQGEPLRALLGVLEGELCVVEEDIARLYNNWFIETCDEWVVPYLGDLVGSRLVHAVSQRAFTANTLAYRRRKGTAKTLAAVARDLTTWPARAVEYLPLTAAVQSINSPRPELVIVPDLRDAEALDYIGTPFERAPRTVDVRTRGRYNLNQVALYVWRLAVFPLQQVRAALAEPGRFYVNPLGENVALWSPAHSRPGLLEETELELAPQTLRRRVLYRALERRRQALVDGRTVMDPYFDGEPVVRIFTADAAGRPTPIPAAEILIADLSTWWSPPSTLTYSRRGDAQPVSRPIAVALDPELGRLAFPAGQMPSKVWVSYYYGFSAELGGGGYERKDCDVTAPIVGTHVVLASGDSALLLALGDPATPGSPWQGAGQKLTVELCDSDSYSIASLRVPAGATLELRARSGQRPLLTPTAPRLLITLEQGATLRCNGLLLAGGLTLQGAPTNNGAPVNAHVTIMHSTIVPGPEPSITAGAGLGELTVTLTRSISGAIVLAAGCTGGVVASDSIVECAAPLPNRPSLGAVSLYAATASLSRVTVFGSTQVATLKDTIDTLFCALVDAPSGPAGGVSYCYLPDGSTVNQPDRCQPATALSEAQNPLQVRRELRPWFVSRRYGTPSYAQLDARCHPAIRMGASVGGELGALHSLQHAQRELNLVDSQDEYLRFGLTLNLFLVT